MNEYDLCTHILSPKLCSCHQMQLIESKPKKPHKASIVRDKVARWTLYRYDQENDPNSFFPFFNNTSGERTSPKDLLKFCDYIVFVEKNDRLFILLVEMKSGETGDARKQLEASETFIHFILKTAERIASVNGYREVNIGDVCIRKIILKPQPKPVTNKSKSVGTQIDLRADVITFHSQTLPLFQFCKAK